VAKAFNRTDEQDSAGRRDDATGDAAPERSLGLAGATLKARYRLQSLSSVSRYVATYAAEDLRSARPVVLKVLREEVAADAAFVTAVRDQASTLAMFPHLHRGVARVYECDAAETGDLFVAVERTQGVTLREMLDARGPLDPSIALRIATRIGEALEALHHNGILHGQLAPDAVVMLPSAGVTEHVTLVGVELTAAYRTPLGLRLRDASHQAYRAPEQLERGETAVAADVYALGVLLREMLTAGGSRGAAPPPMPPEIERIVATATDPRPEGRYPDISVMLNDMWGAHTQLATPAAEAPARPPRSEAPARRRRRARRPLAKLRVAVDIATALAIVAVVWLATDRLIARYRAGGTATVAPVHVEPGAPAPPLRAMPGEPPVDSLADERTPAPAPVVQETPPGRRSSRRPPRR
jgi:serine/threonine-protein kinase